MTAPIVPGTTQPADPFPALPCNSGWYLEHGECVSLTPCDAPTATIGDCNPYISFFDQELPATGPSDAGVLVPLAVGALLAGLLLLGISKRRRRRSARSDVSVTWPYPSGAYETPTTHGAHRVAIRIDGGS